MINESVDKPTLDARTEASETMILRRPPRPALRPFVSLLWATDGAVKPGVARELMLPTGAMHVAIRLSDQPVRLFDDPCDPDGRVVGTAVLNGVRVRAYRKQAADSAPSVGAMLRPGAAELLSNTPAGALRDRHTRLEDLWPVSKLAELRERLEATPSLVQRLAIFEEVLASRLPVLRSIDPLIAEALFRLDLGTPVGRIVAESGFSHRHLLRVFTESVGAAPKAYFRLTRFNRTLRHLHAAPHAALADIAAVMGYSDQAHMTREFQEFAGLTPRRFLRAMGQSPHHVPLAS